MKTEVRSVCHEEAYKILRSDGILASKDSGEQRDFVVNTASDSMNKVTD